jgi:hypothetical protein
MKKEATIITLKTGICTSSSGRSKLNYHIGEDPEASNYIRIYSNSGNGFCNDDWLSLSSIVSVLESTVGEFTTQVFQPLLRGKSKNTPAFLMAVLLQEGLVLQVSAKKRCYVLNDVKAFQESLKLSSPTQSVLKNKTSTQL